MTPSRIPENAREILPMRFFLEVRAAPGSAGAVSARQFAEAVAASEHQLWKVFFVGEGACHADLEAGKNLKKGEQPPWEFWEQCAEQTGTELLLCAAAAQQLEDRSPEAGLSRAFTICGMGEVASAQDEDVRLISFNP